LLGGILIQDGTSTFSKARIVRFMKRMRYFMPAPCASILLTLAVCLMGVWKATAAPVPPELSAKDYDIQVSPQGEDSVIVTITLGVSQDTPRRIANVMLDTCLYAAPDYLPPVEFLDGRVRVYDSSNNFVERASLVPDAKGSFGPLASIATPRVDKIGLFRGHFIANLTFSTVAMTSNAAAAVGGANAPATLRKVIEKASWRVRVRPAASEAMAGGFSLTKNDPWAADTLRHLAANASMLPSLAEDNPAPAEIVQRAEAWTKRLEDAASRMPLLRLRVAVEGIYKIVPEDLAKAGVATEPVDASSLRLISEGEEIPIIVIPDAKSPGKPSAWKAILFYSPGVDMIREPHKTYWLVLEPGGEGQKPPLRLAEDAWDAARANPSARMLITKRDKKYFQFENYHHELPFKALHGRWGWAVIPPEEFREMTIEVPEVGKASGQATLTLELSAPWRANSYTAAIYWNRKKAGEAVVLPKRSESYRYILPLDQMRPGANILGIEMPEPNKDEQKAPVALYVTDVQLEWASEFGPPDNAAAFKTETPAKITTAETPALLRLAPGNRAPEDVVLIEVSNNKAVRRLGIGPVQSADGKQTLCALEPAAGEHRYWMATADTALKPWRVERRNPPRLSPSAEGVDYLAISTSELLPGVERLISAKQRQGMRALSMDIEEIIDAFGYGQKSSHALADFLKYAYAKWTPPRLFYVCFAGETSDYLADFMGVPPNIQEDMIPNYEWGHPDASARGDFPYSYVCGNDALGDLAIGRISVASPEELSGALDKAIAYQDNPPPGVWRARHLFFTDDEPEFREVALSIITDTQTSFTLPRTVFLNEYPYQPYFRHIERRTSAEANEAIRQSLGSGVVSALYLGHGGLNIMSSEKMFHIADIPLLPEGGPPTFLGSASCHTAWLDYPITPWKASIGELIVKVPRRGAIGMFGPVAGASSGMHEVLFKNWYRGVNLNDIKRTGDIALYAQDEFYLQKRSVFVPEQYVLIGDPALPIPSARSKGIELNIARKVLIRGVADTVHVEGNTPSIAYGWADLTLRDTAGRAMVPDERVRIRAHRFSADLVVDGVLREEPLYMRVDGLSPSEGKWEMGLEEVDVIQPQIELTYETRPPLEQIVDPNQGFYLTVHVKNASKKTLPDLDMQIRSAAKEKPIHQATRTLEPGQTWSEEIVMRVEPDVNYYGIEVGRAYEEGRFTAVASAPFSVQFSKAAGPVQVVDVDSAAGPRHDAPGTWFSLVFENKSDNNLKEIIVEASVVPNNFNSTPTLAFQGTLAELPAHQRRPVELQCDQPYAVGTPLSLDVRAALNGELPEQMAAAGKPPQRATVVVRPRINLRIVPGSTSLTRKSVVRKESVYIQGAVENAGTQTVRNILVQAYFGTPWDNSKLVTADPKPDDVIIEELAPGQRRKVRVRLDAPRFIRGTEVYLVANSNKAIPEDTYDDNDAMAFLSVVTEANLAVASDDPPTTPILAVPGQEMKLFFNVTNTNPYEYAKACDYRVEVKQPGQDWEPAGGVQPLRAIGGGKKVHAVARWIPTGRETLARIFVNTDRFVLESITDDNATVYPILSSLDVAWKSGGEGDRPSSQRIWKLSDLFERLFFTNSAFQPTGLVTYKPPREFLNPDVRLADPITSGGFTVFKRSAEIPENQWGVFPLALRAVPGSRPPTVAFRLKAPANAHTNLFDVYLHMPQIKTMNDGKSNGKILARFGGESEMRLFDSLASPIPYLYAGSYQIGSDGLLAEFGKPEDDSYAEVMGIQLVPRMGIITSPAMRFPADTKPFKAGIDADTPPGTSVVVAGRWGHEERSGMIWSNWETLAQVPAARESMPRANPSDTYFQLEVRLIATKTDTPSLREVTLTESAK